MKRFVLSTIMLGFVFLVSCVKDQKVSPDLRDLSGPVVFTEDFKASTTTPNFANGDKVYFTAKFEKDASWVITITGNASGATKTIKGVGAEVLASVASWDGTADTPPSFRAEVVTAKLSFPLVDTSSVTATGSLSIPITIAGKKNLNEGHVLITDFSGLQIQEVYNGDFAAVPPNRFPSDFVPTTYQNDIPLKNPDGNRYVRMGPSAAHQENADSPGDKSPYIDFMRISAFAAGYPGGYFPLIADPTKIYFNIMMYNIDPNSKTWLQVTLNEVNAEADTVGKSYNIRPRWTDGWKQVSINYLDFKFADTTIVSNNPQKIVGLQLTLLSDESQADLNAGTNQISTSIDHLIFTHYGPYQP